jgi:hypothetical protein
MRRRLRRASETLTVAVGALNSSFQVRIGANDALFNEPALKVSES